MKKGIFRVWQRNFFQFQRAWAVNLFWILLEPTLYFLALGFGLGSFVSSIQGVSYIEFFFPGFLCITSMLVAFFTCTYDCFSKLTVDNIYSSMLIAPLSVEEIILGEIFWGASKGTLSALGVIIVAFFFGRNLELAMVPSLVIIFLSSFFFSAVGLLVTSYVDSFESIIYTSSGFIIPMSLFSGTYFPLDSYIIGKYVAFVLPLTHTVSAVRGLLLGNVSPVLMAINVIVLVILTVFVTKWALRRMNARLIR